MRGRSNSNLVQIEISHQFRILNKAQQTQLQSRFKKAEASPGKGISFYDMVNILELCGFKLPEDRRSKLNKDILTRQIKILDLNSLYWAATSLKKEREEHHHHNNPENSQYLDAFIALGGNNDKSGYVNKETLMRILKQQFGILFDIEKLVNGHDLSGDRLDFTQFCQLFEKQRVENPSGNVLGLLSARQTEREFVFTEKEFYNYENSFEHQI